ncbi:hypothetical protein CYMTET_37933 [Cymbomonas tetramitiformis]|uniref:Transmembrane protein n=1 Tax=Cymbomonas tetramitiformis TaxID=36881 RepID=A0AAE0CD29_9CHLO|nr:hypothetical protein CYMTET_37933 [Cymbomonas tetramitiformis]
MAFQAVERVEYNHRAFANGVSYLLFGAFCVITFYLIYTPYSELSERRYYYTDVEEKLPLPHLYFCPFFYTTDVSPAELDAAFWVDSYEDSSFVRLSCAGIEYTVDGVGNQGELCEEGQEYNDRAVRVRTVELQGWGTCLTVDLTGLQVVDKKADIQVEALFNASYDESAQNSSSLSSSTLSTRSISVMAVAVDNNQEFLEESYSSRIDGVSRAPMSSELLAGNFKAVSNTMGICSTRTKVKERFTHDAALYLGLSGTTEDTLSYTFAQSTGQLYSPGSIYSLDDSASANVLPFEDTEVILQSLVFESIQVRYYKEYNPISVAFIIGLIGGEG